MPEFPNSPNFEPPTPWPPHNVEWAPEPPNSPRVFYRNFMAATPRIFVTHAILGLNILIFAAMVASGVNMMTPATAQLIRWGANYGPLTGNGQAWRLLTNMFLHIGILHIGMNMWALWNIGRFIERLLGNVGFAIVYLLTGLAGSLASLWWHPGTVSAGASGAIFGLFGALLGFVVLRRDCIPPALLGSLLKNGLVFVGLNVAIGMSTPQIDMAAHIGGLLSGLVAGVVLSQPLNRARAGRPWRNTLVAAGGGVAIGVLVLNLPHTSDVRAELTRFEQVDSQSLATFNGAVHQLTAGTITDEALADVVEQKVLPPWRQEKQRLQDLTGVPREMATAVRDFILYMNARQQQWEMLIAGLRQNDPEKLRQAKAFGAQADRLAGTAQ